MVVIKNTTQDIAHILLPLFAIILQKHFYKLIRILEGNLFMIQDASSFAEETKGEDIYVKVKKKRNRVVLNNIQIIKTNRSKDG